MSGTNSDFTFDFSKFLPAVNQTNTLVKFFGATVNQLFQPGASKSLSGYIGQVPSYNYPPTDFYVQEPDDERSAYQLEPTMVSFNQSSTSAPTVANALTYPDFVAYLMNSSAVTTFQPRLFENNFFTWAPPVDIDKLLNYSQYYWVGGVEGSELDLTTLPILSVSSPVAVYSASANQTAFTATGTIAGLPIHPAAYVNGVKVSGTYNSSTNIFTLGTPANAYDTVLITLYDMLANNITGLSSLDLSALVNYYVQYDGDGFTTEFNAFNNVTVSNNSTVIAVYVNGVLQAYNNANRSVVVGDDLVIDTSVSPVAVTFATAPSGATSSSVADVVTIVTYSGMTAYLTQTPPSTLNVAGIAVSQPALTSGLIFTLTDPRSVYHPGASIVTYFVDGVGSLTRLTDISAMTFVTNPQYQTIDRSSIDENAWSLHNFWVHQDSYAWAGSGLSATVVKATRPIIEFIKDMVLYKYGVQRIQVDALMTQDMASWLHGGRVTQISLGQINSKMVGSVAVDNGSTFVPRPNTVSEHMNATDASGSEDDIVENGSLQDSVNIEHVYGSDVEETLHGYDSSDLTGLNGLILRPGMVLLVINNTQNGLYSVANSGGQIVLNPINDSIKGQYFTSPQFSVFGGQDVYFNGTKWVLASVQGLQQWSESVAPLFYLYNSDSAGVPLDDPSMYTGSNFAGSEIFTYATGTGAVDSVLLKPLKYDNNGYILFENKTVTERYTYSNGLINGLYCYGIYIKANNATVVEGGNLTDVCDSYIGSGMGELFEKHGSSVVFNFDPNSTFKMPTEQIDGASVGEYMTGADYSDADNVVVPDTISYYYKTYSLWLLSPNVSQQAQGSSFPSVPPNLQANPLSQDVSYISLSDWNVQFTEIIENQTGFTGNTFAGNNYRDTARNLALGTEIVQNQAPMLKAMLLSSSEEFDVPNAIRFAEREYKKFKNKFSLKLVDLLNRGVLDNGITELTQNPNDPANWAVTPTVWAITALNQIKTSYNSSFPFALSTMAGGNCFIPPTSAFLGMTPPTSPMFVVDNTYSKQPCLIRGHDGSYLPAFGTFTLTANGYISSDWRDHVFLALEVLIYQNLPSILNNTGNVPVFIQERLNFDVFQWMDNPFYTTPLSNGYSRTEVNTILSSSFEQWVQQGKFDYRTYGGYDQSNPFTWNFSSVKDRFGNSLPGNWRGIYQYYYDTDHPHTRPWEMLGFAEMPNWWIDVYGTSYGSTNTILWHDLENGFIAEGPRLGTDLRYARPGLHRVLPVDAYGNLLDPVMAGIVPLAPTQSNATKDWVFGDWGPVEAQWRNSSSYRFALSELGFLMKPPRFIEIGWDTINYGFAGDQWVDHRTGNRPLSGTDLVHGELDPSGNPTVIVGIQQWIVDGLMHIGKSPTLLGDAIRNLDVRLVHRMAGFVSTDGLKAVSDTFGLLPSEDVQIALYNAPAFDIETYTGVIIEWTGNGYRALGYDNQNPYFTIFPPNTASGRAVISIAATPEQIPFQWRSNTYYTAGVKVLNKDFVYQCNKSHTSGPTFDLTYWTALGHQPKIAPRVFSYGKYAGIAVQIPYGTVFPTLQSVSDFLLGLQAWQVSRGWLFNEIEPSSGLTRDWKLAVKEFLEWSQVSWAPGNFIALSPGAEKLNFISNYGTVLNVEDAVTGFFGLLDRSGNPISSRSAFISRLGSQITLQSTNADIYGARLRIAETEHILVFSNTTIFDDILYIPLFNLRQARLKLIANVSTNWNGRLTAPGFVLVGNDLVPNFDKNAEDIRTMFDIEKTDRTDFLSYARHNIGYQARSYMQDLLLSDTEQFEFFQGMIQAKGSPSVFERLLRSTRINENSDILFLEEWAIRQSHYGAPFNPRITMTLPQNDVRSDPQLIVFNTFYNASPVWIEAPLNDPRWLDAPPTQQFFPISTKPPVLPSAGPVRLNEVQYTSFNPSDLNAYFTESYANNLLVFRTGERVWIYDNNGAWDVWRVFEIGLYPNPITQITVPSDDPTVSGMRIYFQYPLTITENDIGGSLIIDSSSFSMPDLIGVQVITGFDVAGQWIEVDQPGSSGYVFTGTTIQPTGRIFRSVRFANTTEVNASIVYNVSEAANLSDFTNTAAFDALDDGYDEVGNASDIAAVSSSLNTSYWIVGDIIYVDNDSNTGKYAVRQWDGATFNVIRNQPVRVDASSIINSSVYKAGSAIVNEAVLAGQQTKQNAQLVSDQPLIDSLTVIDPIAGLISGLAGREIMYQSDIDPANYNAWDADQVGQVWWDLATCRYLDPYTDVLGASNDRDIAEITHRSQNWAKVAPNASVDVYEWVESTVPPAEYASAGNAGTIYNAASPAYVQKIVYSAQYGVFMTLYYFWVKGLTIVPNVPFRNIDISTVTSLLTNPSVTGVPWIAPIMPNGLIVSGVQSALDNISSTMMVEIANGSEDKTHAEWILIDQNDSLSLPPSWLTRKMRDSLGGFQDNMTLLPNPSLSAYRSTGIYEGQNMFTLGDETAGPPQGILDARKSFVGIINNILARSPVNATSRAGVTALMRKDESVSLSNQYLFWTRPDDTWPITPPPSEEYTVTVYSSDERNKLILTQEFIDAVAQNSAPIRILIDGTNASNPFWSIWIFDPAQVNLFLESKPSSTDPLIYLYDNAESVFSLATSYDAVALTYAKMIAGDLESGTIITGTRIFVVQDEMAYGFWTIYVFNGTSYILHRAQLFDTIDFIKPVDWYAQNITINNGNTASYSASNPPTVTYATTGLRDQNEGTIYSYNFPQNLFVSVADPSSGTFTWYEFDVTTVGTTVVNGKTVPVPAGWTPVALSGGTIALTDAFYTKFDINGDLFDRFIYGLTTPPVLFENLVVNGIPQAVPTVVNRDGSWEIRVLFYALTANMLSAAQINEMFFSMIHFIHTQQNSVDWIFKTSFMTVGGFAIPLKQTGILLEDPTTDLIAYINEVKPYRVKVRDYSQQYSLPLDQANVGATDFDLPSYFDSTSNSIKSFYSVVTFTLEMVNGVETLVPYVVFVDQYGNPQLDGNGSPIIPSLLSGDSSKSPWDDWYTNFLTSDNVRSIKIKLLFDRVVGEGYSGYDIPPYSTEGFDSGDQYGTVLVFLPWLPDTTYNVGDPVSHNNNNYICKTAHTSGASFTVVDWTLQDNVSANQTAAYRIYNYYNGTAINNVLTFSYGAPDVMNIRQKGNVIDANDQTVGDFDDAPDGFDTSGFDGTEKTPQVSIIDGGSFQWVSGTAYSVGAVVQYQNAEYQCIVGNNDSTFTPANWSIVGNVMVSINAPTDDNFRSISDTQTIILPNGMVMVLPLGGIADPLGYGLRDPYIDADVPEERVPLIVDDTILLNIKTRAVAGAAIQSAKVFDISTSNRTAPTIFPIDLIPESSESVLVFRDGLLADLTTDYTVDQLGRTVTVNVIDGPTKFKTIHVHAVGTGSNLPLNGQFFLSSTTLNRTYELAVTTPITAKAQLSVTVGGVRTTAYAVGSDHSSIVLSSAPPTGTDIVVRQYQVNSATEATFLNVQNLAYKTSKTWTLNYNDTPTLPIYAGTMVFVNGKRLMPPLTFYGIFNSPTSAIPLDYTVNVHTNNSIYYMKQAAAWTSRATYNVGDTANYKGVNYVCVTANSSALFDVDQWTLKTLTNYTSTVPIISTLTQTAGAIDDPQFAFLNGTSLVSQNSNFISTHVSVTLLVGADYTLNGSNLKITSALSAGDDINVINFKNSAPQQAQTYTYAVKNNGAYPLISLPPTNEYAFVSYNGLMLLPDADYQFLVDQDGNPYMNAPSIVGSGFVIITIYPGVPYRGSMNWLSATNTPSSIRMQPKRWDDLSEAEKGSMNQNFTFSGDFDSYLSLIPLGDIVPDADTVFSITVNGMPYTDPVPVFDTSMNTYPTKTNGDPSDAQFVFFGSSLISLNYDFIANASTNGGTSPAVIIELQDIPVPIFANLDGWAGLVPYNQQDTDPYDKAVKNQNGIPQPEFVYTMVDWNNTRADTMHTAVLNNDLMITDLGINLDLNQTNYYSPKLGLQYPFFIPTPDEPGVVWINGERIEYRSITYGNYVAVAGYPYVPTTATLTNIRRATQGTCVPENRVVVTSPYPLTQPYQTVFNLVCSLNMTTSGIVQVMKQNPETGRNVIVPDTEYTIQIAPVPPGHFGGMPPLSGVTVTLNAATDDFYIVSITLPLSHSEGSTVHNGNQTFGSDVPVGPNSGNRYFEPVNYLVNKW